MAGSIIPLWNARDFDFSSIAGAGTEEMVLVKAVDLLAYRAAVLLVRVHSLTVTGSAILRVRGFLTAPSPDDPSADFTETSPYTTATLNGMSAGELTRSELSGSFGAFLRVTVQATQSPVGPETIQARLSAGIVGRR